VDGKACSVDLWRIRNRVRLLSRVQGSEIRAESSDDRPVRRRCYPDGGVGGGADRIKGHTAKEQETNGDRNQKSRDVDGGALVLTAAVEQRRQGLAVGPDSSAVVSVEGVNLRGTGGRR
jgi:hypothetical protein